MTRRKLLLALLAAPLGGVGWFKWSQNRNPYYAGPPTDHYDGLRFFNPDHKWSKSPLETLQAVVINDKEDWPESWPSPFADAKPPARVEGTALRVTAIGHATHLIQTSGLNILTDPVWSERASPIGFMGPKRVVEPGIAFDDLPKIDVVLLSHNHYDHLDLDTLARIEKRDRPRVIAPLGNNTIIKANDPSSAVEAYDWGAVVPIGPGVTATLAPAYHWSARNLTDRRKALWCAYAMDFGPAGKVYFGGDSGFGPGTIFRKAGDELGPFRLAIIPIGAYEPRWFMGDQHMNPAEAVEAFKLLKAEAAVGCHWGVFQLTAEAIDAPEKDLATALGKAGVASERFRALRPGEVWESAATA